MAINVNTVYQTVLMILNKEQRGYMTPTEFNKVATQVQLEIFEDYFDDLNKQLRVPQADTDYADRQENIDEKIAIFKTFGQPTPVANTDYFSLPSTDGYGDIVSFYRLGNLVYDGNKIIQRLDRHDYYYVDRSKLTKPTTSNPVYLYENKKLFIKQTSIVSKVTVDYVRKHVDVNWVIRLGSLGQYEYNDLASVDFELHESEQTEVILKILLYAGIIIRDNEVVQTAAALVQADAQKEVS